MMCGNSNGWSTTTGCRPRKSLTAAANVGRAVVKTSAVCPGSNCGAAGAGTFRSKTRHPRPPASARTRIKQRRANTLPTSGILTGGSLRRSCRLGSHAANEVDGVPHVSFLQRVLHRLHFGHGRGGAVPDHRVDFAVARPVIPFVVGQIRGLGVLWREGAVTLEPKPMTLTAVHVVHGASGVDRGRGRRHRVFDSASLGITAALLRAGASHKHETNTYGEECSPHSRHQA